MSPACLLHFRRTCTLEETFVGNFNQRILKENSQRHMGGGHPGSLSALAVVNSNLESSYCEAKASQIMKIIIIITVEEIMIL
jgi:hypothetical protein